MKQEASMLGRWAPWYSTGHRQAVCYGPSDSYRIAEEWLCGRSVEDWGCGYAQFQDMHAGGYRGIDGTPGWAHHVADLTTYLSPEPRPEGILLRHVLEHNHEWRKILKNAMASFTQRLVLVVFTPDSGAAGDTVIAHVGALGVDDLALQHAEIRDHITGCGGRIVERRHLPTATGYTGETIWLVERA